jgi:predicted nucleic acid-binding protein
MNVVDSSGWLEYFARATNTAFFAPVIHATSELLVPTVCIYEVYKRIVSQRDDEEDALAAVVWMAIGQVVDLNQEIALNAAVISHEHKLSMADSIILATARKFNAILWTQDAHFAGLEDVQYIEKASRSG